MNGLIDKLKGKLNESSPELRELLDKSKQVAAGLAEKAAPVLREASSKAGVYAKEKSPELKAQALQALADARDYRAALQEKARNDKAALAEYVRTMYLTSLTPEDEAFIDERFQHYERHLSFMCVSGEVLETEKRAEVRISASHSVHASGGGYLWQGTGSVGMSVSSSSFVDASTTTAHEFWLRLADGSEKPIYLHDSRIPLRKEQRVSLLFCCPDNSNHGALIAIVNHNAQSTWPVLTPTQINARFGLYTKEAGFFNAKEVNEIRNRLLCELELRIHQLAQWASRFEIPAR